MENEMGRASRTWERRQIIMSFVGTFEGKRPPGRNGPTCEDNINIDVKIRVREE
jgi:hypothetical protein